MSEDTLVARVRALLNQRQGRLGLNDAEFAEHLGIDYATLHRMRSGKHWPRSLRALAIVVAAPRRSAPAATYRSRAA